MMVIGRWMCLVLVLLAAGGGAPADEVKQYAADDHGLRPTPEHVWLLMTHDETTTTSRCVGQVDTLACALDT